MTPSRPAAPAGTPHCTIVPPYLLAALAASDDAHLASRAGATLRVDDLVRRGRVTTELRPGSSQVRPRVPPGTEGGPVRVVFDAEGGTDLPGRQVRTEGEPDTGDTAVTEAFDGLGATWALWQKQYQRTSLDDRGLPLLATVHYGQDYDNAFWDGTQMVFGDGDGVVFLGFTRSLDVIGHELAHGVTQYTSGLNYQGQSGALNESVSDVFGVLVKQHLLGQSAAEADWLVGAELLAPGVQGVALRSMAAPGTAYDDPRLGKDPQPAHYEDYVDTTSDNGGVHINSGIPNKAFHDLALALGGNAWERAGQIWHDTVTGEIRADCDFATFAALTLAAVTARFGGASAEVDAVRAAWAGVGVGTQAPAGEPDPAEPVPAPDAPPPPGPGVATHVRVWRTGGVAGMVREATVALEDLPPEDGRQWRSMLAQERFRAFAEAAGRPGRPDAFCYGVACERPVLDVEIPEPALPTEVRGLLERALGPVAGR